MTSSPDTFSRGGWSSEVERRLRQALVELEGEDGPVAVFDFDNTLIRGDIGELFSHYLIDEFSYRYDLDAFWALIDREDGRESIRALTQALRGVSPRARARSRVYCDYLAEMGAVYGRKYARAGKEACFRWAVRLHVGLSPAQIREWTHEAIDREIRRPLAVESRRTGRGEVVRIRRGIRRHVEMRELMDTLVARGFEVWVVSATNQWSVEAFAERAFGVPRERVLGNRVAEGEDGLLCDTTLEPVLFGQGKVEIIEEVIGRRPALVFGDSVTDREMMRLATHLAVLVDRGEEAMLRAAKTHGWAVQPQRDLTHDAGF